MYVCVYIYIYIHMISTIIIINVCIYIYIYTHIIMYIRMGINAANSEGQPDAASGQALGAATQSSRETYISELHDPNSS